MGRGGGWDLSCMHDKRDHGRRLGTAGLRVPCSDRRKHRRLPAILVLSQHVRRQRASPLDPFQAVCAPASIGVHLETSERETGRIGRTATLPGNFDSGGPAGQSSLIAAWLGGVTAGMRDSIGLMPSVVTVCSAFGQTLHVTQPCCVLFTLRYFRQVIGECVVFGLVTHVDVFGGLQSGGFIQRSGHDADIVPASGKPEQT